MRNHNSLKQLGVNLQFAATYERNERISLWKDGCVQIFDLISVKRGNNFAT
jgi:hypothetical protein